MGPYYRGTSQGVGGFFNMFYEHPILMSLIIVGIIIGGALWYKKQSKK